MFGVHLKRIVYLNKIRTESITVQRALNPCYTKMKGVIICEEIITIDSKKRMEQPWIMPRDFLHYRTCCIYQTFILAYLTADAAGTSSHGKTASAGNQGSVFPCSSSYVIYLGVSKFSKLLAYAGFLSDKTSLHGDALKRTALFCHCTLTNFVFN